ncbi:putative SWI/SNF complex 60 kDa subunit [Triangularia verruculosa]|uniref:SWI/SNF complex 60 kDa subunit n=1 Tax=Triangularia verruculosa TaxID=2587418 RepID=A0AAN7AZX5_9PEZI|nr:putative SWI/SNF complex 60 kDa subunit [Triangularia verruculosa]
MQSQQQFRPYATPHGHGPHGTPHGHGSHGGHPGAHAPPRSGASHRRGGIGPMMSAGPHPQVPMTAAQINQQHFQAQQANQRAKIRSRKPTDKNLPDGIDELLVGGPDLAVSYKKLRDFERRLDATMTRKKLDIMDSLARNTKHHRKLRIWITNTVEDQYWQATAGDINNFEFSSTSEATYTVTIEARLLDDPLDLDKDKSNDEEDTGKESKDDKMDTDDKPQQKPAPAKPGQRTRFAHFFKALTVEPDRPKSGAQASETIVEWKKPDKTPSGAQNLPAIADFDEFAFKRPADENLNITIKLFRHEEPERFAVSPVLADIIDETDATLKEATLAVYEYIKLFNLQEDEETRNFRCDDYLKKLIGRDMGIIGQLPEYITPHLRPLPPIKLPYTIRVDEEFHKNPTPTIYDITVPVDDPMRAKYLSFLHNPQQAGMLKEIARLDDQLATVCQALAESKARHTFFTSMANDPVGFVRSWLSSQKRDLDIILGESARGNGESIHGDEWRKGGRDSIWNTANARESVNVLLSRPPSRPQQR